MRKFIIILAVFVTLLLVAAIVIPVIFKEDIQKGINKALHDNIEADIFFEPSKFSLTLFHNFPHPRASIEDFGIIGIDQFQGDTLLSVKSLDLTIDLFSLFGDAYTIKSINLSKPLINVTILKNGAANYEIATETPADTLKVNDDSSTDFTLLIDEWNISDGTIKYSDQTMDFQMIMEEINHSGSGNISLDNYDLVTLSDIKKTTVFYEGTNYLNGQSLFAKATLNIDLINYKFTFKNNDFRVNDFPFSINGYLAMTEEDIEMDLSFSSTNSSIKSLYSLIPGAYTSEFENINTEGTMSFDGFVEGIYNESTLPSYNLSLNVADGKIIYPDLTLPLENIDIDMLVECKDGNMDNTRIEIKQLHMNAGSNPVDAKLLIRNLKDYSMNADIEAHLNLAELSSIFPIEGLDMKGIFSVKAKADGVYDSIKNIIPSISATMNLKEGYIKSNEFPKALDKIAFSSELNCPTGEMKDFMLTVDDFSMKMGDENLSGSMQLADLVDYTWNMAIKGDLDLEVISQIYPVEGMNYNGLLSMDMETRGKYSDVEAERYNNFPTSGKIKLRNFDYNSVDLPQGFKISETSVLMNPQHLTVESFDGAVGNSDLDVSGKISNYLDFVFTDEGTLQGKLKLISNVLDLNEWMTGEGTVVDSDADSTQLEVIEIPGNVDFQFQSSINNIYYDNLNLQNAKGLLIVKDGVLDMSNLSFNLLGGSVVMNGKYDTRIPDQPIFNYQLNIKSLSIPAAFTSFSTVQAFAPMAGLMNGNFSTNFKISGMLNKDMSPAYESLNGNGLIRIVEAHLKESKLVTGIAGFMKSDLKSNRLTLKDVIMKTSLENGRAHVSPFDVNIGGQKATMSGSIGADGTLDYYLSTEIEAGAMGQQVNQLISSLQGKDVSTTNSKIKLNFNVGGTYENPKIRLAGTTSADGSVTTVQDQVKDEVKQEISTRLDSAQKEAELQAREEAEKLVEKGEEQLQQQLDTLKKALTKDIEKETGEVLGKELDSTTNELKKSLKNLFRKKKKDKN